MENTVTVLYQQLELCKSLDSPHSPKFLKLAHGGQLVCCLRVLNSLDSFLDQVLHTSLGKNL